MLPGTSAWYRATLMVAAIWLALVFVLHPTFQNMEAIWGGSTDTYSYGYVILPITLWLLWRERHRLARLPVQPEWRFLPLILFMALTWLVARLSGMQVVEQYAFVSIAILTIPAFFGWSWFRQSLFPFLFLLLMVPNGDFLLPHLINYTADFTTLFVRLFGVPLYREGPYLTLPTGQWAVVEACGGLRYLTASITLGFLYAYLTYRTLWKQLLFAAAIIGVALLANGLRAVIVVLVGHYSNMTMMIGEDHLWLGWGWFGVVMIATFWIGAIWREDHEPTAKSQGEVVSPPLPLAMALTIILSISLFPLWANKLADSPGQTLTLAAPLAKGDWNSVAEPATNWTPKWENPDAFLTQHYQRRAEHVIFYVAYYARQRQGAELISHNNQLHRAFRGEWEFVSKTTRQVTAGQHNLDVAEVRLWNPTAHQRMLIWQWNLVDGKAMTNPYMTKLKLALGLALGKSDAGAAVVVAAPYEDYSKPPQERLQEFVVTYGDDINRMLQPDNQ